MGQRRPREAATLARLTDTQTLRFCPHGRAQDTEALARLTKVRLTVRIGGCAMRWHLPEFTNVTDALHNLRDHPPGVFALPHPSWRNTGSLKENPWFGTDVLPPPRRAARKVMDG